MKRWFSWLAVLVLSSLPLGTAEARDIAGQHDPKFTQAVQKWLDGNDLDALKSLSGLSKNGNTAAQILLASIASRSHMHQHVTSDLTRSERISLLRVPRGLSGRSWLTEAQATEPLATAILQSAKIGERAGPIAALIEYGEPTRAMLAGQMLLSRGDPAELLDVLEGLDHKLPEEASILLLWALYYGETVGGSSGPSRASTIISASEDLQKHELAWTSVSPRVLVEDPEKRARAIALSVDVRSWTPITNFCEANCLDSKKSCVAVGASALKAAGLFPMPSPAESIIPNDVYWSSPRAEADLARQIIDVRRWDSWKDFVQIDACFFESMRAAQARYGHAK